MNMIEQGEYFYKINLSFTTLENIFFKVYLNFIFIIRFGDFQVYDSFFTIRIEFNM